jgi:guanylate kinase
MFIESSQFHTLCSISTTTRPQRRKEDDGIDYFFTTQEEFEKDVMEVSYSGS